MRILVIDDEPEILTIVSKWLSKRGHDVRTTSDPEQAMEFIQSSDFDIVLTDLMMPRASGLNLLSRIHEKKPKLPAIVMSVIEDTRVAVLAAQEGIVPVQQ